MKNFLIINTSFFGDILLTGPLCSGIKKSYPDATITFIVNSPFTEAAMYLDGVDNVIVYDKKGRHRGISGIYKFYKEYRHDLKGKIDAAFIIYGNERGILLAYLFKAKHIYAHKKGFFTAFLSPTKLPSLSKNKHMQDINLELLSHYTGKKYPELPMSYTPPQSAHDKVTELLHKHGLSAEMPYICLCPVSKLAIKDMPISTCIQILQFFASTSYQVILTGAGQRAVRYSEELSKLNKDYIDFTNATSLAELGALLQNSRALISVDTGTMHMGLSVGTPVIALFYIASPEHLEKWSPKPHLYKTVVLKETDLTPQNIFNSTLKLIED